MLQTSFVKQGRLISSLIVGDTMIRNWSHADETLLAEVAGRTWAAVERAKVEEAMRKSEEKYRTLFNSIDEGFSVLELIFDEHGKVVDYWHRDDNPSFVRMTGIQNPLNKRMSELVADLEPEWHQMLEQVYHTGEAIRTEYSVQQLGQWYSCYLSRLGDSGSPFVAAVYDDITERKQRELNQEFLLKFSDLLRTELIPGAVANRALALLIEHMQLDRSYITSYYLDENRADLDYQLGNETVPPLPDHFILSDYPEAFKAIFDETFVIEDELERQGLSESEIQNSGKLGMRAMVAATVRKGGDHPLWSMVAISSKPRRWTPGEINLVEEVAERTWAALERSKAEMALRSNERRQRFLLTLSDAVRHLRNPVEVQETAMKLIAESLDVDRAGYYEMDDDEDNYTVTARYDRSAVALPSRGRLSSFDPDLIAQYRSGRTIMLSDSEKLEPESLRDAYRAAGVRSWVVIPLVKGGHLLTAIGLQSTQARNWTNEEIQMLEDVAERTWAAVERAKAEHALRESQKRKDEFLAMLAHELRNPMATLRSGLKILELTATEETTRSTVTMMDRQTDFLVRMVDDLLDVSRISLGKIGLKEQRLDLTELVAKAAESIRIRFDEQGHSLHVALPADRVFVHGDSARLTQVISNLLTNGLRYSKEKGNVWVQLKNHGHEAEIEVSDDGIGLAADQIEVIFELFVQVDNSLARSKGGLGLGLTLVKRLVEMHGGRVEAGSEGLGKGSSFSVFIPTTHPAEQIPDGVSDSSRHRNSEPHPRDRRQCGCGAYIGHAPEIKRLRSPYPYKRSDGY